jgi:hypothetical protein
MHYVTVFDAATADGPMRHWSFWAQGLVLVAAGLFLVLAGPILTKLKRPGRYGAYAFFGWIFFSFACLWTIGSATMVIWQNLHDREAVREGRCSVVAGLVENFHPDPPEDHASERFDVSGVHFEYSTFTIGSGFNLTVPQGGPMREGLPVRICYSNRRILRLEIADGAVSPAPPPVAK